MKKLILSTLFFIPLSTSAGLTIVTDSGPKILEPKQAYTVSIRLYTYPGENREDPKKAVFWSIPDEKGIFEVMCRDGSIPRVYDPRIDTKKPAPPADTPYQVTCP